MFTRKSIRNRVPAATVECLESRTFLSITPFTGSVDLTDSFALKTTTAIAPGKGKTAEATVTVTNDGTAAATGPLAIAIEFSLDSGGDDPVFIETANVTLHNLGIDASKTFNIKIPVTPGTPPDNYYFLAVVDPENTFNESNTDNNLAVTPTALDVISPYPDMMGTLEGTFKVTAGPAKGASGSNTFIVETESGINGDITGTATNSDGGAANFEGTITTNGTVTMDLTDTSDSGTAILKGKFSHGKLSGTYVASDGDKSKIEATLVA